MKNLPSLLLFLALSTIVKAQSNKPTFTYENFEEQVIAYQPEKKEKPNRKYSYGLMVLDQTKAAAGHNPKNLNHIDFWNIGTSFMNLGESKEAIAIAFKKAITAKDNNICYYLNQFGPSGFDKVIPELFYKFYSQCQKENTLKPALDLKAYAVENNLDYELLKQLYQVQKNDSKYRDEKGAYYNNPEKLKKQNELDKKNQEIIETLFKKYGSYLGNSLVGKEFNYVMWIVIQHSNIPMMERYLPIIHKAVKDNEVQPFAFKMLLDRIYAVKYGYQVFGSQLSSKINLATEAQKKEVEKKYGIK